MGACPGWAEVLFWLHLSGDYPSQRGLSSWLLRERGY